MPRKRKVFSPAATIPPMIGRSNAPLIFFWPSLKNCAVQIPVSASRSFPTAKLAALSRGGELAAAILRSFWLALKKLQEVRLLFSAPAPTALTATLPLPELLPTALLSPAHKHKDSLRASFSRAATLSLFSSN